ncbi:Rrf2 family transcriptional regulator [Laribacter hongkongensis]|nr:Rrf2 family transcriptional regulator [Laribacter hongkongensis]
MQLTMFSDLSLRTLMYLTYQDRSSPVTITELATRFMVSRNHLVKSVHFMSQKEWIVTTQGKGGGVRLSRSADQYNLGQLLRQLEGNDSWVSCQTPPCVLLAGDCRLKQVLKEAQLVFFEVLDQYSLADLVAGNTGISIAKLHHGSKGMLEG